MRFIFLIATGVLLIFSCEKHVSKREINESANVEYMLEKPTMSNFSFVDNTYRISDITDEYKDTLSTYLIKVDFSSQEVIEKELTNVYARDQTYRDSLNLNLIPKLVRKFYSKKMSQADYVNREIIKLVFRQWGWPDTSNMNEKARRSIWLTHWHNIGKYEIQHLQRLLAQIGNAFENSLINSQDYASLTDKINVRLGKKQEFGTLLIFDKQGNRMFPEINSNSIDSINTARELIGLSRIERVAL